MGTQSTNATCAIAHIIGGCGGSCAYIFVNGGPPTEGMTGAWWGLGGGNPLIGTGDDNAAYLLRGNADPGIDWIKTYSGFYYLAGTWSNADVDGCVDNATTPVPKRTVVTYQDSLAGKGWFLTLCQRADASGNYDYSTASHLLAPVPRAVIVHSSRLSSTSVSLDFHGPSTAGLAAGTVALDPSCEGLIRGYQHYFQVRPNAAGRPTDLRRMGGGWLPQGGEFPIAAPSSLTLPCGFPDTSVWVATTLVFDSGFETWYVSEPASVHCDPTLADRPGDFRIIKRPRAQQRQQQN